MKKILFWVVAIMVGIALVKTYARSGELPEVESLESGQTLASNFWDDGSGINGDSGAPASGNDMQAGMFASPSWPMCTVVKVRYKNRSVVGFIGDRGPGEPSYRGPGKAVMLDLDTYSWFYLADKPRPSSRYAIGGHLKVRYEVLRWGTGPGYKEAPRPFDRSLGSGPCKPSAEWTYGPPLG